MMTNLIFLLIVSMAVFALVLYARGKAGSWSEMAGYFKQNKALNDWKPFIGVALVILIGITLVWNTTRAEDKFDMFVFTEVSLGVDYVYNGQRAAACDDVGVDNRLAGNGQITQNIFELYEVQLNVAYQHHSCALNGDDLTYDAIGINITRRWEW